MEREPAITEESIVPAAPVYGPPDVEAAAPSESADIVVTGMPSHPVDGRSVEIGLDGVAVQLPCPVDKIGPVNLSCGAGVSPFDLGMFARVRGSVDLGNGWRGVAELNGAASADMSVNAGAVLGVATPPIAALQGASLTVGVNPASGTPSVRVTRRF